MPLTRELNGSLLIGGDGTATVLLKNGLVLSIMGARTLRRKSYLSSRNLIPGDSHFFVTIGQLPVDTQETIRANINKRQRRIHENTPEFKEVHLRGRLIRNPNGSSPLRTQGGVKKVRNRRPPESIDIYDDYKLVVRNYATYDGQASLKVGEQLIVTAKRPFDDLKYPLGEIIGFTIP